MASRIADKLGGECVAFSPDGKLLAAGYGDSENGGRVYLYGVKGDIKRAE